MPNVADLPYLLHLLEDESLRRSILEQLSTFGSTLEDAIEAQQIRLTPLQALEIRSLWDQQDNEWIVQQWSRTHHIEDDMELLKRAQELIAQYQFGRLYPAKLRSMLDALADEFDARYTQRDALLLAEFLFQGYALRGVEQEGYYNPFNSNLVYVIEQRRGLPINLVCIYMLVGWRLELSIGGYNFPDHFLALVHTKGKKLVVDCFDRGRILPREQLLAMAHLLRTDEAPPIECDTIAILQRVLRNLIYAYTLADQPHHARTMERLQALLRESRWA